MKDLRPISLCNVIYKIISKVLALFQMHSAKAQEPDGLNPTFFKLFWHLCEPENFHTCVLWLNHGEFPSNLVKTDIVLIPKKGNPESMKDLRPIYLCNVIYKIISKVLANRMKVVFYQNAFLKNNQLLWKIDPSLIMFWLLKKLFTI